MTTPAPQPFEHLFPEVETRIDDFAETIIASLESSFLTMPKGQGFVEYAAFENAYQAVRKATHGFQRVTPETLTAAVASNPLSLIVLRTMLGFTPPEWAYVASERSGQSVTQGSVRTLDRSIRLHPEKPIRFTPKVTALIETAGSLLSEGAKDCGRSVFHRLDKADTRSGIESLAAVSTLGVPYAMLLYERLLGRPFASHRDSISELVGDYMESPVEEALARAGISYRKTKRAERIEGFEQAPDFIVPDEFNPQVVIEAKITEDDGTARDKVTRIQHLATLSQRREGSGLPGFQVIACIDGRGFGIRREDMKKMLRATQGKVFTLATLNRLVECTLLNQFRGT